MSLTHVIEPSETLSPSPIPEGAMVSPSMPRRLNLDSSALTRMSAKAAALSEDQSAHREVKKTKYAVIAARYMSAFSDMRRGGSAGNVSL